MFIYPESILLQLGKHQSGHLVVSFDLMWWATKFEEGLNSLSGCNVCLAAQRSGPVKCLQVVSNTCLRHYGFEVDGHSRIQEMLGFANFLSIPC